jgi:hypothetical protein
MKKAIKYLYILPLLALFFILKSCIIQNPKPKDCEIKEITVARISEGDTLDIVFYEADGDFYYINRGLGQGLTLEGIERRVLNKKVTLHLANTMIGTSNQIAQLTVEDEVVFTEFIASE